MAECRITFQRRHRAVPAPEGCGAIYTTHDTDQGIQRSKTHFARFAIGSHTQRCNIHGDGRPFENSVPAPVQAPLDS